MPDAQQLAERIVWAVGAGYRLHTDPLTGGANPGCRCEQQFPDLLARPYISACRYLYGAVV